MARLSDPMAFLLCENSHCCPLVHLFLRNSGHTNLFMLPEPWGWG